AHEVFRHEVAGSRIHITEGKWMTFQIGQAVDAGVGLSNEQAVKVLIALALNERLDTRAPFHLNISKSAKKGNVDLSFGICYDHAGVVCRHAQLDLCTGLFLQVSDEGLIFAQDLTRVSIGNHAQAKRP